MTTSKLFQYAIIWHPSEKQKKEENLKSKLLVELTTILSSDQNTALITASIKIPNENQEELDQIEIVIRPF